MKHFLGASWQERVHTEDNAGTFGLGQFLAEIIELLLVPFPGVLETQDLDPVAWSGRAVIAPDNVDQILSQRNETLATLLDDSLVDLPGISLNMSGSSHLHILCYLTHEQ